MTMEQNVQVEKLRTADSFDLQTATLPVLYETLKGEGKDGMRKVELELLNRLEVLMTKKQEEENRDEFFEDIISTQFPECLDVSPDEETSIEQNTDQKMSQELMKILVDYRSANSEGNLSLKIMCTHRLMDFYQRSKEFDMFFKCIHKLSDLHLECGCFTEAALALKVHADNHEWKEDVRLEEFLIFPTQTEWERKEALCLKIIEHFNEGKEWEMALLLCNELMEQYKQKKQFRKLAEIMHKQGNLYEAILDKTRQPPTYFKVSFYGKGFPQYLKDEVLVYRGQELETLAGFTSRICTQFPTVKVIYKNGRPDDEILKSDGQHIQICTVLPISEDADEFIQSFNEDTQAYYRINNVEKFSFNRPFHRGEKDPKNEFKTLWLERTTQTVENKFPNILRWSRIVKDEKIELPPIVNAIEMICSKNKELQSKVDDYAPLMKSNASQLSMVLNGVIDANVNGGIANYQSAFLSPEYLEENPKDEEKVEELKEALIEQSNILNDGLKIHEYYVNESLRPFHDKMMLMYSAMKISIETGKPMELDLLSSMNNTLSARSMSMPGG
ncbi:dedicator of cytokinesis protein 3-like isoform X3 [Clytia hemisphaerica]|uniref:DOCKER domain-containing protein n=1 Tax=Clytia hemisphaerica TaxID=252671 RepID=A0A7M5WT49_9CNID